MESPTISIHFVETLLRPAAARGIAAQQLLEQANIPARTLKSNRSRITAAQFSRLQQAVAVTLNDEACGFLKTPMKPGAFNTLARYTREAEDLANAFNRSIEFQNLFDCGFNVRALINTDKFHYQIIKEPHCDLEPWAFEQTLMINHRYFCWLTGKHIPVIAANFHYPAPQHQDEYRYLFRCPISFNQQLTELVFEKSALSLPITKTSEELEVFLNRAHFDLLKAPANKTSFTEKIRRYVRKTLPRLPDYDQVAEDLGLTPQTLRRRLRKEGADYRQIKNELIRDMAMGYLRREELETKEIAYLLGFSEPSAFIRSFKKWTGTTPHAYRQDYLHQHHSPG